VSPYTNVASDKKVLKILFAVVGVILLGVAVYFVMSNIKGNDFQDDNVTYVIGR
jgi:hypothetical protein